MTHKNKCAGIIFQRIIEGLNGFHVHMVGRFIHHHDIGLLENQFTEQQAPLLSAGNDIDGFINIIFWKQEPPQSASQHLLILPCRLPLVEPVDKGSIGGKVCSMVLCKITDIGIFRPFDRAAIRQQITYEAAQQRCFAYAIGADNRNSFPGLDHQVESLEQRRYRHSLYSDRLPQQPGEKAFFPAQSV